MNTNLWIPMDSHGFLWIPMDSYGFPMNSYGFPMGSYGFLRIPMEESYGFLWIPINSRDYSGPKDSWAAQQASQRIAACFTLSQDKRAS
jgi:hypothetical protein